MFFKQTKKNYVYPYKPQFYYIKERFKGVKILQACFRNAVYISHRCVNAMYVFQFSIVLGRVNTSG